MEGGMFKIMLVTEYLEGTARRSSVRLTTFRRQPPDHDYEWQILLAYSAHADGA